MIQKKRIILSGGGVKGFSLLGAIHFLQSCDFFDFSYIQEYYGVSVGAILATLFIIDYKANDVFQIIYNLETKNLMEWNSYEFLEYYGFDNGKRMKLVIEKLFEHKQISPNITFLELFEKTKKHLKIFTTCLNDSKSYTLDHITEPDLPVIHGILMSISIPLIFQPVPYKDSLFIDGCCSSVYPIHNLEIFDDDTLGILLHSSPKDTKDTINSWEEYITSLIQCVFHSFTNQNLLFLKKYTIEIQTPENISSIDFNISQDMKKTLFNNGYDSAKAYFDTYYNKTEKE